MFKTIVARMQEPSTWAGVASLLGLLVTFHVIPQADLAPLGKDVTMMGMGLGGLLAIFLPEAK